MLNKVWGKSDEDVRELAVLEDSLKEFFAKHKEVRQVILAPKHWVIYFRVTCISQCFSQNVLLGGNLKFLSQDFEFFASHPDFNIRLTLCCFVDHAETARRSARARAGTNRGNRGAAPARGK